jgi:hypothetical protein
VIAWIRAAGFASATGEIGAAIWFLCLKVERS